MRVTQTMIYGQTLRDIQRSLQGSARLQQQIATGLRVLRPSDDPAAILRILPLEAELRRMGQLRDNAGLAKETTDLGAGTLEDASELVQRVRELTVQGKNGTVSESDRKSIAAEIDQILDQMVGLANTQRAGRFLFAGTLDRAAPFSRVDDSGGTRVVYAGNQDALRVEVSPGIHTELTIPGTRVFQSRERGPTAFAGSTGAAPGSGFDTGVGLDRLDVAFAGLSIPGGVSGIAQGSGPTTALGVMSWTFTAPDQLSINGAPPVTVTPGQNSIPVGAGTVSLDLALPISPSSGTFTSRASLSLDGGASKTSVDFQQNEVTVRDGVDGSVLHVDVSGLALVGSEEVTYTGTFDAFSTLVAIRDVLRGDRGGSPSEIGDRLTELLRELDGVHDQILEGVRTLGFRSQDMELLGNRVETLELAGRETMSDLRDTDMVDALMSYQRQETIYQASLQVGARIVQTSLLNFLR